MDVRVHVHEYVYVCVDGGVVGVVELLGILVEMCGSTSNVMHHS